MSAPQRVSFSRTEKFVWGAVAAGFVVALWWHGREPAPRPTEVLAAAPAPARRAERPFPADDPHPEPGSYSGRAWTAGAAAWREAIAELRRTGDPFIVYFYSYVSPECERVSRHYLEEESVRATIRATTKVRLQVPGGDLDEREICRILNARSPEVRVVRLRPPQTTWDFPREETVRVPFYWPTGGLAGMKTPWEYGIGLREALGDVLYRPPKKPFPGSPS